MTRCTIGGLVVLLVILILLVPEAQPALADTSEIGRNVGDEVKLWATTLLLAVAGIVALPVLARRDVNGGLVLALLVVLLGGFVFSPNSVKDVITALWGSVAG